MKKYKITAMHDVFYRANNLKSYLKLAVDGFVPPKV